MKTPKKPDHLSRQNREDTDSPALTVEQLDGLRALKDTHPGLAAWSEKRRRGQRGPQVEPVKVPVSLRLDPAVVEAYKAKGPGWQTLMNDTLSEHAPK